MAYRATCRHCCQEIFQHPVGMWSVRSPAAGEQAGLCQETYIEGEPHQIMHEPMPDGLEGAPEWIGTL